MKKKDKKEEIDIDDVTLESEEGGENLQKKIVDIKNKLKICEAEKKEYLNDLQRAKADFSNLRKRDEELNKERIKFATEEVINLILPVLDSFEMALKENNNTDQNVKNWLKGFESIYNQLFASLKSVNLEKINSEGEIFNPREHEAIGAIKVDEKEKEDLVLEVVQSGYKLNGKVIRTAKVKVGSIK